MNLWAIAFWTVMGGVAIAAIFPARRQPRIFGFGALLGAVLLVLLWSLLGTLAVLITGSPRGGQGEHIHHSFAENVAPAWPIFLNILWKAGLIGALAGGLGLVALLEDPPAPPAEKK